ncbi:TetR/AcrR family transcriptional regulator [Virgibacillus xinjiangensis]|uniref:TetR/AcrR family transcriptional regulator n=1 Tax=Virgibacillus xinjiangensis TaxID=393090 RepID=A0ABV7CZP5_9BACI
MNKSFDHLEEEKKTRILNAAMKEFADKKFDHASTNEIVRNAGIGKGMLFYYFNNKQDLFYYLIGYSLDVMAEQFLSQIDTSETDFVERMKQIAEVKLRYFRTHPDINHFIASVYLDDQFILPVELRRRLEKLKRKGHEIMYENIDKGLFRQDIDIEKAFHLIQWAMNGYQEEVMSRLRGENIPELDLDIYWQEFYDYLEVLKTSFYKKEGEKQ